LAIVSNADSDMAYGFDEDWAYGEYEWRSDDPVETPDPCITPTGCFADFDGYSSTDEYYRDKTVSTAELRATSKQGQEIFNGSTAWVAGVYFKQDNEDLLRLYTWDSDFTSTNDSNSIALYGQFNTQLAEQWSLVSGLRIENRSADYINSENFDDSIEDTMIGGKLVLSYHQADDSLWYASINRGYKAGGHNTEGSLPDDLRTFEPEYLLNYELGYKVSLLDNAAYVRTAIFYMDRTDVQVKSSKTIEHDNGNSSEFSEYIDNAATGSNYGIEVESAWHINDFINVYGSLGLLETEFNDFINAEGDSLDGREQAHAPNYQFNLGINIEPIENWLINLSVDGKDSFYFSDSHDEQSESVVLLNASIAYSQDNWQVKLWGRNLTDEEYANRGFYFGNDPRDGYAAKQYTQLSEPLVFGATLDYQF